MHSDADFDDVHIVHKLQSLPLDNPAWDPCQDLTDPFERQYEDALARASDDIHDTAPDTDNSTATSTPYPSLAERIITDDDNNEQRAPTQEGERTLSQDWEQSGKHKIDEVDDSSLVEYM